jgi:hypothetical protein
MTTTIQSETAKSVSTILGEERDSMITDWKRRVRLVPRLTTILLSDEDRTSHLPRLIDDVLYRLQGDNEEQPVSVAASAHGRLRFAQSYSVDMLVEESRIFEVTTFGTLHRHRRELDQNHVLDGVMIIADEADRQLEEAVKGFIAARAAA